MAQLNIGVVKVKKIYVGNDRIKEMYLGNIRVYSGNILIVNISESSAVGAKLKISITVDMASEREIDLESKANTKSNPASMLQGRKNTYSEYESQLTQAAIDNLAVGRTTITSILAKPIAYLVGIAYFRKNVDLAHKAKLMKVDGVSADIRRNVDSLRHALLSQHEGIFTESYRAVNTDRTSLLGLSPAGDIRVTSENVISCNAVIYMADTQNAVTKKCTNMENNTKLTMYIAPELVDGTLFIKQCYEATNMDGVLEVI